ncbi:SEC-C domain-containing protein [Patescibacteria group bacterium]|nr:SEC-C domain-containing protein [Patescibacteria group bacterium]
MRTIFPCPDDLHLQLNQIQATSSDEGNGAALRTAVIDFLNKLAQEQYKAKETDMTAIVLRQVEKMVLLQTYDKLWVEHLEDMKALRESVGLRGYGQRDPLVEYKKEGFKLFQSLLDSIRNQVVYSIYKVGVVTKTDTPMEKDRMQFDGAKKGDDTPKPIAKSKDEEVGRNEPCPCGSGKKYKKCCGKSS